MGIDLFAKQEPTLPCFEGVRTAELEWFTSKDQWQ